MAEEAVFDEVKVCQQATPALSTPHQGTEAIAIQEMRKSMPVSKYAARELAVKAEVSVLKQLISQHSMRHSVLRGILFEMLFIKGLSLGLEVTMSYKDNPTTDRCACDVVAYSRIPRMENLRAERTCLQPMC
eukprot:765218-Hanusia_phi.AAC.6